MTATLSTRTDQWLYQTIVAGVTAVAGRVHGDGAAPTGFVLPYADFALLSSLTIPALEGTRVLQRLVYLVEVVDEAESFTPLEAAADQIYTTLHRHAPDSSVSGIVVTSCVCEEEVRRVGTDVDQGIRYLGFRVRIETVST